MHKQHSVRIQLIHIGEGLQSRGWHQQLDGDGFRLHRRVDSIFSWYLRGGGEEDETATEGLLPISQRNEQSID
jgi:hypothetical protein